MVKALIVIFLLAVAGCSAVPSGRHAASPCFADEASYECQVERYHNISVQ